jgi:8-oxo-dGTP pyrophosphatase MutT (NUDIX family)
MAPEGRLEMKYFGSPELAAVMLLVFPVNNIPNIVFIKRPIYDGAHSNQVSFPGGRFEKIDIDLATTAIRETQEELGINLNNIKIIGKLTPLLIPISGYEVHPYVGVLEHQPTWQPDPEEVLYTIDVPLKNIFEKENQKKENWIFNGIDREVPFYAVNSEKIWGATAMILAEFETIHKIYCLNIE